MYAPTFKERSDLHLTRKVWHFTGVLVLIVFYHNFSRPEALQTMIGAVLVFGGLDALRQFWPKLNQVLISAFRPVMRSYEEKGLAGTTYLLLGVLFIIAFFPKPVVHLTLFFLAGADPLASYVGLRFGKDKWIGSKSLQGSLAAFLLCTVIAAGFFLNHQMMVERIIVVSLLAGLIGAFSEVVPIGKLDDNLTFPVVCSTLLFALMHIFGGL